MTKKGNQMLNSRKGMLFIVVALVILGLLTVIVYMRYKATHISTDDAFIEGSIHVVASKVGGTVKVVHVKDNQPVKKGDPLVDIDEVDYQVRVDEAHSALESEKMKFSELQNRADASRMQLTEIKAAIDAAKANVRAQEANLEQARFDLRRYESLYGKDAVSKEKYERIRTSFDVAEAQGTAAKEKQRQLEASLNVQSSLARQAEISLATQRSVIQNKKAVLDGANLNRGYTKIVSPSAGYVTRKNVEVGNQVAAGTPLMAVVPLGDVWIVANYKETELKKVKAGQRVEIDIDMYPGQKFKGKVESIMAGTGASFSLFPAENATGNYVKIVQRIPVKIVLEDSADKEKMLRIGMSVVPTIIVE